MLVEAVVLESNKVKMLPFIEHETRVIQTDSVNLVNDKRIKSVLNCYLSQVYSLRSVFIDQIQVLKAATFLTFLLNAPDFKHCRVSSSLVTVLEVMPTV